MLGCCVVLSSTATLFHISLARSMALLEVSSSTLEPELFISSVAVKILLNVIYIIIVYMNICV